MFVESSLSLIWIYHRYESITDRSISVILVTKRKQIKNLHFFPETRWLQDLANLLVHWIPNLIFWESLFLFSSHIR